MFFRKYLFPLWQYIVNWCSIVKAFVTPGNLVLTGEFQGKSHVDPTNLLDETRGKGHLQQDRFCASFHKDFYMGLKKLYLGVKIL